MFAQSKCGPVALRNYCVVDCSVGRCGQVREGLPLRHGMYIATVATLLFILESQQWRRVILSSPAGAVN